MGCPQFGWLDSVPQRLTIVDIVCLTNSPSEPIGNLLIEGEYIGRSWLPIIRRAAPFRSRGE